MRVSIALVVWVVLMILWLLGGGYYVYNSASPNNLAFGVSTLIPWTCVLIPGLIVFGAVQNSPPK